MTSKKQILDEISRIAKEIDRAPGQKFFVRETGISHANWNGKFWPRWSEALKEAGLKANEPTGAIAEEALLRSFLTLVEEVGKIPTQSELRFKKKNDPNFPAVITFQKRYGTQRKMALSALEFAIETDHQGEARAILEGALDHSEAEEYSSASSAEGHVYLLQSGKHYKIGQSSDLEKRVKQIAIALPQKVELVHAIRTDDPVGIEAYWHRRFVDRRKNGEWFELSRADIKAFRKRRFQ